MWQAHASYRLAASIMLWAVVAVSLPAPAHAQPPPDSLAGQRAQCVDFRSGETFTIGAQHLLADGSVAPQWSPAGAHLCLGTAKEITSVSIPDGENGAVVVWVDMRTGESDLYAQRLTASGSVAPGWPSDGVALCLAPGFQDRISVASDGAGGAIAVWQDYRSGPNGKIFAQRVTGSGVVAWAHDGVAVAADSSDQGAPAVAADGSGGALVIWQDARNGDYDLRWAHSLQTEQLLPQSVARRW